MTAFVRGAGWIDENGYGTVREGGEWTGVPARTEIFTIPFRNFGRLDVASRATCYAVALALKDAGLEYPLLDSVPAGIVGTGRNGCADSDAAYFKDYLDGNRILGRGNLFIYTLPTSPLAEAAIHFGLSGPLFHVGSASGRLAAAARHAAGVMNDFDLEIMLAGTVDGNASLYAVLAREPAAGIVPAAGLEGVMAALAEDEPVRATAARMRTVAGAVSP